MDNIDFALVEKKRPPLYTAMKYWGKKPHNIWGEYIENYTKNGDLILDPFSGSAIAAFEAVRCGRKAIAFDINPLTSFIIEVYATKFDFERFKTALNGIVAKIENDKTYTNYFTDMCEKCGYTKASLQHFKWDNNEIYELGTHCPNCGARYLSHPSKKLVQEAKNMNSITFKNWYPEDAFFDSPSFTDAFKKNIGGNSFYDIWTKRNLYVLSEIFAEITKTPDEDIKKQLLFGFIQSIHLCSKMCVPRREKANRSYSTSWGRSAYICSKRQMEMNPLILFKNNCIGKQSVQSALESVETHIGKIPSIKYVDKSNKADRSLNFDIKYGTIDINTLADYVDKESVDFIITDPPYGGLVQYLDLSHIWLIWLKKYDRKFTPNIDAEITIKKDIQDISTYSRKFTNGIKNLYKVLKPEGKIVFTFHNKDLMVWNAFLRSISEAGLKIEKVIHQQNRRTGESNVANPYGTSASDFYIRCSKSNYVKNIKTSKDEFENFIVDRAVNIIKARNEPTPYQILFNGLLAEISKAGFELENFDVTIKEFLDKHTTETFVIIESNALHGNSWWIKNDVNRRNNVVPLSNRVEKTVETLLKNKVTLSLDEILAEIYIKYPDGLTPDVKKIDTYIKKHAYKSGEKWIYNGK